jgi:hypothetical protein
VSDDSRRRFDSADDLTRRQWILQLGEFVALAGVSGLVPEMGTSLAEQAEVTTAMALPPGLYSSSQDHLTHALSSGGKNWNPPEGSETEYAPPSSVPYRPQFFSLEDFRIVVRLVEVHLGNVAPSASLQAAKWFDLWLFSAPAVRAAAQQLDPRHRALASAFYGESAVRELETAHPDAVARVGIRALRDVASRRYGRDLLQLTEAEQFELLRATAKAGPETSVHKFFELMRSEAIRGYYTSPEGLEELDYRGNAYYGQCPGCETKT